MTPIQQFLRCILSTFWLILFCNLCYSQIIDLEDHECRYDLVLEKYKLQDSIKRVSNREVLSAMANIAAIEDRSLMQVYCQRIMDLSTVEDKYYYKAFYFRKIYDRSFNSWDSILQIAQSNHTKESDIYKMLSVGKASGNFSISSPDCTLIDSLLSPVTEHIADMEFFYFTKASAYQIRSICAAADGDISGAIAFERQRKIINETYFASCARQRGSAYISMGRRFQAGGKLDSAIFYFQKAKDFFTQYRPFAPEDHLMASVNIASVLREKGLSISAIEELNQAKKMAEATFGESAEGLINADISSTLTLIYNRLGNNYENLGNAYRASDYFQKALNSLEKINSKPSLQKVVSYHNIGQSLLKLEEIDRAESTLLKGLEYGKLLLPADHAYILSYINALGSIEAKRGNLDKSFAYYDEIDHARRNKLGDLHYSVADNLLNLADVYVKENNTSNALSLIDEAIEIYKQSYGSEHPSLSRAFLNKSKILWRLDQIDEAIALNAQGQESISYQGDPSESADPMLLMELQISAAEMLYQKWMTVSPKTQDQVNEAFENSVATFELLIEITEDTKDQSEIVAQAKNLFDQYANFLFDLHSNQPNDLLIKKSLQILDKGRAYNIKNQLASHAHLQSLKLASGEIDKLRKLENRKAKHNFQLSKSKLSSLIQIALTDSIEQINNELQGYEHSIAETYESNLLFKQESELDINEVQNTLSPEEMILTLSISKGTLRTYFIFDKQIHQHEVTIDDQFLTFLRGLQSSESSNNQKALFSEGSEFFKEVFDQIPEKIQYITIIADKELTQLAFEVLPYKSSLLLDHYTISYAPSLQVWILLKSLKKNNAKNSFAGFAPEYLNLDSSDQLKELPIFAALVRSGTLALPFAQKEVKEIQNIVGGDIYIGNSATKEAFKSSVKNSKIVHLSMHAQVDEQNPGNTRFLFGTQEKDEEDLLLYELFNLSSNTEMMVLSACETGIGKYHKGDGVKSLANSFLYAGVPSTVMSLWKVPDESTSQIMISFYKHLKAGKRKDESLRLAKIDYLRNTISEKQKAPFYWAGFVLVGDTDSIDFSGSLPYYWYWIGLIVIVLAGLRMFHQSSTK